MLGVTYTGFRDFDDSARVVKQIDDLEPEPLNMRTDLRMHADAPEWGYFGSGCRQLAMAILADVMGDETALELSNKFKEQVIAKIPRAEGFRITAEAVEAWAKALQKSEEEGLPF